jgi:hypothetical protein
MQVSLFASAVRFSLWKWFMLSLEDCSVDYEVVFSGPSTVGEIDEALTERKTVGDDEGEEYCIETKKYEIYHKNFFWEIGVKDAILKHIYTNNIKPAQCYEIARRNCIGELICWVADDCEFKGDIIGKAYRYWKERNNPKLVLSLQIFDHQPDRDEFCDMRTHILAPNPKAPLMAPIGMMSREFAEQLGGFDRRFVCGQYENDLVMAAYESGGSLEIFGNRQSYVDIDNWGKMKLIDPYCVPADFYKRPFGKWYRKDRQVLENIWMKKNFRRSVVHEPYEDKDILTASQSNKGDWV